MILVTGATGNVGQHVLHRLVSLKAPVRALSRDPAAAAARFDRSIEWVRSDFSRTGLRTALANVETVVLITPAGPELAAHEAKIVDAAKASGATRIVKLSGLGAGPDAPIRLPKAHFASEMHIAASGLRSTFVRPNLFYQTLLGAVDGIAAEGKLYAPAGQGRISFTDARDVADVIASAATSAQHDGRSYEVSGPRAYSYADVASALAQRVGRSVQHVDLSAEQQREFLLGLGTDAWTAEAFVELFRIYREGHGSGIFSASIEEVTGRPARDLPQFLDDHAESFAATTVAA